MYDAEIREPLFDYLDEKFGKNRIFEEKTMGRSRADVVMIVEYTFIGLEIKSDADTYERLARQTRDYNRFCDVNYIVIGKSHLLHVADHIPKEWGILCVREDEGQIAVSEVREPVLKMKSKIKQQIKWMWRPELTRILEANHMPKYRQRSKKFVQDKLLERVPEALLKEQMIGELFERDYTLWDEELESYKEERRK